LGARSPLREPALEPRGGRDRSPSGRAGEAVSQPGRVPDGWGRYGRPGWSEGPVAAGGRTWARGRPGRGGDGHRPPWVARPGRAGALSPWQSVRMKTDKGSPFWP